MPLSNKVQLVKEPKRYFRKKKRRRLKKVGRTVRVENAILETLGYRSVFNYPMTFRQLCNFIISKRKVDPDALKDALNYLVLTKKIGVKAGKYYLYKTKPVQWKKRYNNSINLFRRADRVADILSKIPWVTFIGVTGSVAAFNGVKNDDIDFFIVTKPKRVWLTRGFVFVILKILGLLRTEDNPSKKICPNIFVDEVNLAWNKKNRNIYVAHEVVMIHPLYDSHDVYFKFLQRNDWAFKYFGNLSSSMDTLEKTKINKNPILDIFEDLAYKSQLNYMKNKKTNEITERYFIHFNKVDNTEIILGGFKKVRRRIGLKTK